VLIFLCAQLEQDVESGYCAAPWLSFCLNFCCQLNQKVCIKKANYGGTRVRY
jgi:hypothetical protein